jgi:hypothetical protein
MSRILFIALTLVHWASPVEAEVLTLSCSGIMKPEEEQAKPHAITKMELIVNVDAGVVTGFTGIIARIDEINANSVLFNGTTIHASGAEWSVRGAHGPDHGLTWCDRDMVQPQNQRSPDEGELRSDL